MSDEEIKRKKLQFLYHMHRLYELSLKGRKEIERMERMREKIKKLLEEFEEIKKKKQEVLKLEEEIQNVKQGEIVKYKTGSLFGGIFSCFSCGIDSKYHLQTIEKLSDYLKESIKVAQKVEMESQHFMKFFNFSLKEKDMNAAKQKLSQFIKNHENSNKNSSETENVTTEEVESSVSIFFLLSQLRKSLAASHSIGDSPQSSFTKEIKEISLLTISLGESLQKSLNSLLAFLSAKNLPKILVFAGKIEEIKLFVSSLPSSLLPNLSSINFDSLESQISNFEEFFDFFDKNSFAECFNYIMKAFQKKKFDKLREMEIVCFENKARIDIHNFCTEMFFNVNRKTQTVS